MKVFIDGTVHAEFFEEVTHPYTREELERITAEYPIVDECDFDIDLDPEWEAGQIITNEGLNEFDSFQLELETHMVRTFDGEGPGIFREISYMHNRGSR